VLLVLVVLVLLLAGEQQTREYDWSTASIDPKSHRFGLVDTKGQQCSVKQVRVWSQTCNTAAAARGLCWHESVASDRMQGTC
jgi:hypothetical protein